MRKFLVVFLLLTVANFQIVFAKDVEVNIVPLKKITTSDLCLNEGDYVKFKVKDDVYLNDKIFINKNTEAEGLVTKIRENGFFSEPAMINIEYFKTEASDGKRVQLKGFVSKKGNDHHEGMEFLSFFAFVIMGGEVQIKPKKDEFVLYVEEKN